MSEQKKAYIEMINKAMEETNDIPLLDLVWRILVKATGKNRRGAE